VQLHLPVDALRVLPSVAGDVPAPTDEEANPETVTAGQ
jgi:hypothetical protein